MSGITDAAAAEVLGISLAVTGLAVFALSVDGTLGTAVGMWLFVAGLGLATLGPAWYLVGRPLIRRVRGDGEDAEADRLRDRYERKME